MTMPSSLIHRLSLSSANKDLIRQLTALNATDSAYHKDSSVASMISEKAARFPQKTAIRFNDKNYSYQDLEIQTNRLANYLLNQGITPNDIVAVAIHRSPEMIFSILAIIKTGAAYLPLDPVYPKDRIEFMLDDSAARLLLVSTPHKGLFSSHATELVIDECWHELDQYSAERPPLQDDGNRLAYLLYTSGSTGKPKGVQIEHHSLTNLLLSMQKKPGIAAEDTLLAVTTISFDISGLELFLPLITGATVVLADTDTCRDGRRLLQKMEEEHITIMQATPYTWRMILDSGWTTPYPIKALCGGEAFPKDLLHRLLEKCSSLWNLYGPTETTIWSSVKQLTRDDSTISIGRPIHNTQFYIYDEFYNIAPPGIPGEICISGDGLARGYIGKPELTTEKFVHIPYADWPEAIMYRTGDLGKILPNGEIECLGRIDRQVKIHGHRIEISEIELVLTRQPAINNAVVVVEDDKDGLRHLIACIVPSETPIRPDSIRNWVNALKEQVPDYMIPSEFIVLETLPTTSNGKIDREQLPGTHKRLLLTDPNHIRPRNTSEKLVAEIWTEQLNIPDISITSNFFDLGGHSLIAVKVMMALEQQTGRRLPLASIFEHSTIEKLARIIFLKEDEIKWDSLVPIKTSGSKTPVYLIHGSGLNVLTFSALAKYMDDDQPIYGMQALGLNGKTELFLSIEEIAEKYNAEVLANDPIGPYALAGYSLGGFIALEMARQLLAKGKEIKLLGILDTYAGNRDPSEKKGKKLFKKIFRQFKKLAFFSRLFLSHPQRTLHYQYEVLKGRARNFVSPKYRVDEEFFTHEEEVNKSYDIAYNNYFMRNIDLRIHLFKVKQRIYFVDDPAYLGWKEYTSRGVTVHETPGDHKTFLSPPNDREFARLLQSALDKATL